MCRNHELWEAFSKTTFRARDGDGSIDIRVGEPEPVELASLLDRKGESSWMFITGWNPDGRVREDAEGGERSNREANLLLREELRRRGLGKIYEGKGIPDPPSDHPPEESFLVLGATESEAVELGGAFGQAAVVVGERGHSPRLVCSSSGGD